MYKEFCKPLLDFAIALAAFIVLFPVFVFAAVILAVVNKGTPFFLQRRPGKDEKIFHIIKFRTMNDKMDVKGNLLRDDLRLTSVGKFIRKTSIDEIPQLLNVLKGDMSLVGPRPLLVEYLSLYNNIQKQRHTVKPGITGLAQVSGRNAISWQRKFELDVWYVNHLNFLLDMKVLFLTLAKVFKKEGISSNTSLTMEKFEGN